MGPAQCAGDIVVDVEPVDEVQTIQGTCDGTRRTCQPELTAGASERIPGIEKQLKTAGAEECDSAQVQDDDVQLGPHQRREHGCEMRSGHGVDVPACLQRHDSRAAL
jgi:hypothetical protein